MLTRWIDRIVNGRTDEVFELIAAGHPAKTTDLDGVPLMRWCAYYGDVSAVRALVANGEALATLGENFDLNGAAFHAHWRLCQYLLEAGADPNHALPDTAEAPLHAALARADRPAQRRTVAVLLAAGARPDVRTAVGVDTGCFMRDVRTRGETPLHRAAAFADEATIHALLHAGADREALDANGDTPLSWASLHLRPASILRLLCFGEHRLNPAADWSGDHGVGSSGMDEHLQGTPRWGR